MSRRGMEVTTSTSRWETSLFQRLPFFKGMFGIEVPLDPL